MKNYKKIIIKNGFLPGEIWPSISENKSLVLLFSFLSIFLLIFSSRVIEENGMNQIYLILAIPFIILLWFLSERIYREFKNPWKKKLEKKQEKINKEIERIMKDMTMHEEVSSFLDKENVKAQQIRYLIYNIYELSDKIDEFTIEEIIGFKDNEILSLHEETLKKKIKKKIKELSIDSSVKLINAKNKKKSFKKMIRELGFSI